MAQTASRHRAGDTRSAAVRLVTPSGNSADLPKLEETADSARVDGRRLRSVRSKDLVVEAILDLLGEGDMRPSAFDIAARAGVSERTVFRHFADLEQLFAAAAEQQGRRIAPLLRPPPITGNRAARIGELIKQRARLYEEVTPVRRASLRHAPFHTVVRVRLEQIHDILRTQMCTTLDRELAPLPVRVRRELIEALDATLSWASWETMRTDQHLTATRAVSVTERTVNALLVAACGPDRT